MEIFFSLDTADSNDREKLALITNILNGTLTVVPATEPKKSPRKSPTILERFIEALIWWDSDTFTLADARRVADELGGAPSTGECYIHRMARPLDRGGAPDIWGNRGKFHLPCRSNRESLRGWKLPNN